MKMVRCEKKGIVETGTNWGWELHLKGQLLTNANEDAAIFKSF